MMKDRINGYLIAVGGAILFSTKAIFVKLAYQEYDTDFITLLFLRMAIALPLYWFIWVLGKSKTQQIVSRKDYYYVLVLGILGYYMASMFDFIGLKYITASLERLILFAYPTMVLLIFAIIFKSRITKVQIIAILITYVGIILAFGLGIDDNVNADLLKGGSFVFLSAFCFALYIIGSGQAVNKLGTRRLTIFAMSTSAIFIIVHYFIAKSFVSIADIPYGLFVYGVLMAVFSTVIPSFMIIEGIKRLGSSDAAIVGSIGPVSTIVLAYIFLDERLSFIQILGTLIVLMGVGSISINKAPSK